MIYQLLITLFLPPVAGEQNRENYTAECVSYLDCAHSCRIALLQHPFANEAMCTMTGEDEYMKVISLYVGNQSNRIALCKEFGVVNCGGEGE